MTNDGHYAIENGPKYNSCKNTIFPLTAIKHGPISNHDGHSCKNTVQMDHRDKYVHLELISNRAVTNKVVMMTSYCMQGERSEKSPKSFVHTKSMSPNMT